MTGRWGSKRLQWVVVGLVVVVVGSFVWYQSTKNRLITLEESINAAWSQVENQLQRRYDLIPNLVSTVKGYAKHEKSVFIQLAEARSKLAGATTQGARIQGYRGVESALSRLLVVVERYPNLKASTSFNRLMDELAGSENRLSVERRRYNNNVTAFNRHIRQFPARLVAERASFVKKPYFEIEASARTVPNVTF